MAEIKAFELIASVRVGGVPMKVRWVRDGGTNEPEIYIYGVCTFEQAQAIMRDLPEQVEQAPAQEQVGP